LPWAGLFAGELVGTGERLGQRGWLSERWLVEVEEVAVWLEPPMDSHLADEIQRPSNGSR
jgi:hypothetical protein